jgi:hypothetical protein
MSKYLSPGLCVITECLIRSDSHTPLARLIVSVLRYWIVDRILTPSLVAAGCYALHHRCGAFGSIDCHRSHFALAKETVRCDGNVRLYCTSKQESLADARVQYELRHRQSGQLRFDKMLAGNVRIVKYDSV